MELFTSNSPSYRFQLTYVRLYAQIYILNSRRMCLAMHYSLHYPPGHKQQHLKGSRYLLSISVKITALHVLMSNKLKVVVQVSIAMIAML